MIKITSSQFSFFELRHGRAGDHVGLSFLFGDALARTFIGWLITDMGLGWQRILGRRRGCSRCSSSPMPPSRCRVLETRLPGR